MPREADKFSQPHLYRAGLLRLRDLATGPGDPHPKQRAQSNQSTEENSYHSRLNLLPGPASLGEQRGEREVLLS